MSPARQEKTNTALRWYNSILVTVAAVASTATGFWMKDFISRTNNDHDSMTNIKPRVEQVEKTCILNSDQLKELQGQVELHDYRISYLMQYDDKKGSKGN